MRHPLNLAATALALVMLAAACQGAAPPSSEGVVDTTSTSVATELTTTTQRTGTDDGVLTGIGVDPGAKVISIGLLADQTGLFASLEADVVAAQSAYWDALNATGGIDGWTVRYVVEDTRSNTEQHLEKYRIIRDEVVAISLSTGSSANLEALDLYKQDSMLVIPLGWYSGWAIPSLDGGLMLEQNTNYCIEAMNMLDFVNERGGKTIAVAAFDDAYGRDAIAGVKLGAAYYGITVVYEGIVDPGDETVNVAGGISVSGADWTILVTNPSVGSEILGAAVRSGYEGLFIGSQPSYDSRLLDSETASMYDARFFHSVYAVGWGDRSEGNTAMMATMADAFPDRRPADAFIIGWNEAITMRRVLEAAVASGDLTRQGVVRAANSLDGVSFGGSTPDQSYVGTPTEYVQRASAIFKPDLATYLSAGGADQTLTQPYTTTGSILVRDFLVGAAASEFDFTGPCAK